MAIIAALLGALSMFLPTIPRFPSDSTTSRLARLDWIGAILVAGVFTTYAVGFSAGGSIWAWSDARTIVVLSICAVLLGITAAQQLYRVGTNEYWKILPSRFTHSRALVLLLVATSGIASSFYVTVYYIPLLFQFTRQDNPFHAAVRLLPLVGPFIFGLIVHSILMPRFGPYSPWYGLSGITVLVAGALLSILKSNTTTSAIYSYLSLVGFGCGCSIQAAYTIAAAKVKARDVLATIFWLNLAQIGSGVISLNVAGTIYQNVGFRRVKAALAQQDPTEQEIRSALSGFADDLLATEDSATLRQQVVSAVVRTIGDVFLLVAIAGALVIVAAMAMPVERVFYKSRKVK